MRKLAFRERPADLLVLSACETAVGDDRAALGLAGVAVKSGAHSVVASLWAVDDETTRAFIEEFYTLLLVLLVGLKPACSCSGALAVSSLRNSI